MSGWKTLSSAPRRIWIEALCYPFDGGDELVIIRVRSAMQQWWDENGFEVRPLGWREIKGRK